MSSTGGLDDSARANLRRRRRLGWLTVVAGLALFVGFVIAVGVVERRRHDLQRYGVRVLGSVTETHGYGEGGSIEVEYLWQAAPRTITVHLVHSSPRYQVGQTVVVLVDPSDNSRVSVRGETNQSPWTVMPMIGAFVGAILFVVIGGQLVVRVRRQQTLLEREPWQRMPIRFAEIGSGASRRVLVRLEPPDAEPEIHRLTMIPKWARPLARRREAVEAEVARHDRSAIVRVPPSDALVSTRRGYRGQPPQSWERAFDPTPAEPDWHDPFAPRPTEFDTGA
jgi:hypothetical protein